MDVREFSGVFSFEHTMRHACSRCLSIWMILITMCLSHKNQFIQQLNRDAKIGIYCWCADSLCFCCSSLFPRTCVIEPFHIHGWWISFRENWRAEKIALAYFIYRNHFPPYFKCLNFFLLFVVAWCSSLVHSLFLSDAILLLVNSWTKFVCVFFCCVECELCYIEFENVIVAEQTKVNVQIRKQAAIVYQPWCRASDDIAM